MDWLILVSFMSADWELTERGVRIELFGVNGRVPFFVTVAKVTTVGEAVDAARDAIQAVTKKKFVDRKWTFDENALGIAAAGPFSIWRVQGKEQEFWDSGETVSGVIAFTIHI